MNPTGLKSRCQECCISLGGSRGETISWPFPASQGHPHSLAHGPFPALLQTLLLSSHLLLILIFLPPSSNMTLVVTVGLSR